MQLYFIDQPDVKDIVQITWGVNKFPKHKIPNYLKSVIWTFCVHNLDQMADLSLLYFFLGLVIPLPTEATDFHNVMAVIDLSEAK